MEPGLTYIVRIYRYAGRKLTGLVEDVQRKRHIPFSNAEELWSVLANAARKPRTRSAAPKSKTSK